MVPLSRTAARFRKRGLLLLLLLLLLLRSKGAIERNREPRASRGRRGEGGEGERKESGKTRRAHRRRRREAEVKREAFQKEAEEEGGVCVQLYVASRTLQGALSD